MILPTHKTSRSVAAVALAVFSLSTAAASAQDGAPVFETKRPVHWAQVLDDQLLVASDQPRNQPDRIQRVIDGEVLAADGLRASGILVEVEQAGRDRKGRVVVPFSRARKLDDEGYLVGTRWFLYDVAKDKARPIEGLPTGKHTPTNVAVWRKRTAYVLDRGKRAGVYLKTGKQAKRVAKLTAADYTDPLLLRGNDLVMVSGGGDGDFTLNQLVVDGGVHRRVIEPSTSPADHEFTVHGAWLNGDRVDWWQEASGTAGNLVLSTRLTADDAASPEVAAYPSSAEAPLAIDGDTVYTADGGKVYRRELGAPSTAAPANDTVAGAQQITGAFPPVLGARIGFATATADEPAVTGYAREGGLAKATRTVWYSFKPTTAAKVTLVGFGEDYAGGNLPFGAMSVYDDPGNGTLTELPKTQSEGGIGVTFDANPAHRYLIGVGADTPGPAWPAYGIRLRAG